LKPVSTGSPAFAGDDGLGQPLDHGGGGLLVGVKAYLPQRLNALSHVPSARLLRPFAVLVFAARRA